MNDSTKTAHGILWAAVVCMCASPLMAQQEDGGKPKPAARQFALVLDPTDSQESTDLITRPETRPLSGVQTPTIGTPEMRHSYWVPGIQYSNTARSKSQDPAVNSGWNTTNFVSTDVSLLEAWSRSTLSANYSGGGYFSSDELQGHGQYHQLAANYEIDEKRWQAQIVDEFSYLPQSSFGFGGTTGLSRAGIAGTLAVPLPGLEPGYTPEQTILTTIGPRYSNSSAAQVTFNLSSRGSLTFAGVYGILRFVEPGNVNSDTEIFNTGYDYAITRRDTLGLAYRFGAYRYPGDPQALGDHLVQFEYGRKITGKIALKLQGGPEITKFRIPIEGLSQRISGSGSASLTYGFPAGSVVFQYVHGVSSGSGLFIGATSDQISGILSRRLTRIWNASTNFAFGRNQEILTTRSSPTFNTWVAGAGLSRSLGHMANFSWGYQVQIQRASPAATNESYTAHQIFVSFQWHTRPLVLR